MTAPSEACDTAGACRYCRHEMLRVVHGWHCPACHATEGEPEPAAR